LSNRKTKNRKTSCGHWETS